MYYFGVSYGPRKAFLTLSDWAWWYIGYRMPTYLTDIKYHRFLRVLGIELKMMWWEPYGKREAKIHAAQEASHEN